MGKISEWLFGKKKEAPPIENPIETIAKLLPTLCPNTTRFKEQMTLFQQESQAIKRAESVLAELEERLKEQKSNVGQFIEDVQSQSGIVDKARKQIDGLFPGYVTPESELPIKDTLDQRAKRLMTIRDEHAGVIARAAAVLEDLSSSRQETEEASSVIHKEADTDLTEANRLHQEVSSLGKVSEAIIERYGEIISLASTAVPTPED